MKREPGPLKARISQRDAAALYDKLAGFYDVWGYLTESRARGRALELADVRPGQHVLEVAVGTGLAFVDLVRSNPSGRNVGIDISRGMLAKARRRLEKAGLSNYEISIGSAMAIPEAPASFDVLVNNYMFDLLPQADFAPVLAEFRRVLRPAGRLVLVNMAQAERSMHRLYERLYARWPELMAGCRGVSMKSEVEAAGFTSVERQYLAQLGFPSEIITARR